MGVERRRTNRKPLLLEVKYEGQGVRAQTRISDIHLFGVFIDTLSALPPVGTPLKLSFSLPDGHLIETEGVVIHCQQGIGMGIEFTSMKREDGERLRDLLGDE
ncbi:MAG: PilZ domain-containing protein [Acidobacteriota bacterium]